MNISGEIEMNEKVKDFERGFYEYIERRENDICDLALIIASCGVSVAQSMDIAREVYKNGWRKKECMMSGK